MNENSGIDHFTRSPGYSIVFRNGGPVIAVSDVFARDLGLEKRVINEKTFEDLLTTGSRIFYQTHLFPLIRLHGSYSEIFLTFSGANEEQIPVLLNACLIGEGDDALVSCSGIRITKRNRYEQEILSAKKQAEKATAENELLIKTREELKKHQHELEVRLRKLSQSSREHQELSSLLSHDLQEPVRKISMFAKLLQTELDPGQKNKTAGHLHKIIWSSDQMRNLLVSTQQFLSINESRFEPGILDLGELIHTASEQINAQGCEIEFHFPADLPGDLYGDRKMLEQLFRELFTNSFKFRNQQKEVLKITIDADVIEENVFRELENVYQYERFLKIEVTDNGIGFPPGLSDEVFRLFRKGHISGEGYGAGLAFCRKIAELHHGDISISGQPGSGARVKLRLPYHNKG
jgi:phosphoserine phosphatase RsbU/P